MSGPTTSLKTNGLGMGADREPIDQFIRLSCSTSGRQSSKSRSSGSSWRALAWGQNGLTK